jgi:zinc protease
MNRVRVQLGLTYGISSQFESKAELGNFQVSTFTRNETLKKTIQETLSVLKNYYADGVNGEEVEMAKNYLMGQFPRSVETSEKLGYNLAVLKLYNISDSYLRNYMSSIADISKSEVNDVIKKYLKPEDMKILVFGDKKSAQSQLNGLGSLEVVDSDKAL